MTARDRRWLIIALVVVGILLLYGLTVTGSFFLALALFGIVLAIGISIYLQRRGPPELGE